MNHYVTADFESEDIAKQGKQMNINAYIKKTMFLTILMGFSYAHSKPSEASCKLFDAIKNQDVSLVQHVLAHGARVNENFSGYDGDGFTPLMLAAHIGNVAIIETLIKAGAYVNKTYGWDQPHCGANALSYAIDSGSVEAVHTLLVSGAYVDAFVSNPFGFELNFYFARNIPVISYALCAGASVDIVQELINYGANVNEKSMFTHWTPLMIAVKIGRVDCVKALLAAGADKKVMNEFDHNKTAFDYARENNHGEVCELLQR
jgi:ankyrin repeat protein